jgi:hypothetical protein
VIDLPALQLLLAIAAWLDRGEREMLAYLIEENRLLGRRLGARQNGVPESHLSIVNDQCGSSFAWQPNVFNTAGASRSPCRSPPNAL